MGQSQTALALQSGVEMSKALLACITDLTSCIAVLKILKKNDRLIKEISLPCDIVVKIRSEIIDMGGKSRIRWHGVNNDPVGTAFGYPYVLGVRIRDKP